MLKKGLEAPYSRSAAGLQAGKTINVNANSTALCPQIGLPAQPRVSTLNEIEILGVSF